MEKCIGCELCAGVCPARCIYVRGADNPIDDPVSPGERYGFVYEINYLRCIHCDLCVEACPTEAITETKLFEFSFTNRADAIYTKDELLVGDDGRAKRLPWELWLGGEDDDTSAWMRATSASRNAEYEGRVNWSGELGFGVRQPDTSQGRGRLMEARALLRLCGRGPRSARSASCSPRNPVHSALFLLLTLVTMAVFFLMQDADLVAIIQIVVYASAIVVLFLFVITLLGVDQHESLDEPRRFQRPVALALGALLLRADRRASPATTGSPARASTRRRRSKARATGNVRNARARRSSPTTSGRSRSPRCCS